MRKYKSGMLGFFEVLKLECRDRLVGSVDGPHPTSCSQSLCTSELQMPEKDYVISAAWRSVRSNEFANSACKI